MPVVEYRGTKTRGRVFVLVHGAPGDAHQMARLAPLLEEHGDVALVDLPDAGSAADESSLDPDRSVDDVREIVAELAPARVTVVGLSYGAWLAARLASRGAPDTLSRIVLLGGFAALTADHSAAFEQLATNLESGQLSMAELTEIAVKTFFPSEIPEGGRESVEALIARLSVPRMARTLRRAARCAADRAVGRYDVPAVLIHGRHDASIPFAYGEALLALGSRARLVTLETDSHYLTWSHAAECRDVAVADDGRHGERSIRQ